MTEIATLAGGCFWCLEAIFQRVRGVKKVTSGYIGGHIRHPQYRQVCDGNTGHAEAVQIEYDTSIISFEGLLEVFFDIHNPTTRNRQGNDVGSQYRSAIFYHNENQRLASLAILEKVSLAWPMPIVTELCAADTFWPAELEHHDYYNQHPSQPYCMAVVGPKVQKFMQHFAGLLKE
ncbi:peptide-methionine (S)-S-oxide reductase MsrA [Chitinibacter bivalviorum]|nr:peptide-methionine (S)-S-oxide reductase MsrA [Chitinibacter bivalviorum]